MPVDALAVSKAAIGRPGQRMAVYLHRMSLYW
jgi:hypothetical protein